MSDLDPSNIGISDLVSSSIEKSVILTWLTEYSHSISFLILNDSSELISLAFVERLD